MTEHAIIHNTALAIDGGLPCVPDKPNSYLHGPQEIGDEEIAEVTDALRKQNLFRFLKDPATSATAQFETAFQKKVLTEHVLAVNSGTSALIAAMIGLGVSTGDEVIVPGYTYIATAAAALAVGAIPVIAEIDQSLTLDPVDVERKITPRTRLIVPVHMRGAPCQMDELMAVTRRHGLRLLEDCAQANGGSYHGRPLGSIGDAGVFSFQHFKIITAGEGGVVVTNDRSVYERAACYHDSAYAFWMEKRQKLSIAPFLGENYRMSDLNGALALAQLRKRDTILASLRAIKKRLINGVSDLSGIELQNMPDPAGDCGVALAFFVESSERAKRFAQALRAEGMSAGSMFDAGFPDRHVFYHWDYVMQRRSPDRHGHPWPLADDSVRYDRDMCPATTALLRRAVAVPLTQRMSQTHVDGCIQAIRKVNAAL